MSTVLGIDTIGQLAKRAGEPDWLTGLRHAAFEQHGRLPWPDAGDEVWRRTDIAQLDPMRGYGPMPADASDAHDARLAPWLTPLGDEALLVRANGAWVAQHAPAGVVAEELSLAARSHESLLRPVMEADGLTPSEQKLAGLNLAFHDDAIFLRLPEGFRGSPLRIIRAASPGSKQAAFPLTVIIAERGSSAIVIEEDIGLGSNPDDAPLINRRIELVLHPEASVQYCRVQRWAPGTKEFAVLRSTLHERAQLELATLTMGGSLSKAHVITNLIGPHASSRLYGFVSGRGTQHIDQHSLQDHQAPHTFSDLLYKAALKDQSRMIYTGLIRIAKAAKQTNAYQANDNLLLSQGAKAETIPMLEILADDVQCKHGATVGPVDEEQAFYLMSRGIPHELAQRLLVMGFVEPIIQHVPFAPLQERLRQELEGSFCDETGGRRQGAEETLLSRAPRPTPLAPRGQ
ncbi:MAG: Fe-S cluster assembly protein SufD [Candidatus Omnitrophica bacterium]|nr:Fe-S cluster assembly protein SufD [Candidatus Omnitrophota bacterium]